VKSSKADDSRFPAKVGSSLTLSIISLEPKIPILTGFLVSNNREITLFLRLFLLPRRRFLLRLTLAFRLQDFLRRQRLERNIFCLQAWIDLKLTWNSKRFFDLFYLLKPIISTQKPLSRPSGISGKCDKIGQYESVS
jgi:hypothetical protein